MFEPAPAPEPPVAPSPTPVTGTARYVFLVGRLRSRQITIEEATELFAIQQGMIRRTAATAAVLPPPPPSPSIMMPSGGAMTPTVVSGGGSSLNLGDDGVWLMLLALGAGAGVLSALIKRLESGPPAGPSARASGSESARTQ